ncbi:hypothetical protein [Paraburkholderia tropica]|uniref:hypothetical protein n=1 Tax=Paraburkholderia tropica TaxID=92647 RepID=UPI003D2C7793
MPLLFESQSIPNRLTAKRVHSGMRAQGASHYEIGHFYRAMLSRRLWPSQKSMSDFLEVSNSNVSRAIALARIPDSIVAALGGPDRLTFRAGDLLLSAIEHLGEREIIDRAKHASALGYNAVDDVLEILITNRLPNRKITKVQVRLSRDKRTLRVELPEIGRLLPHLGKLENYLSTAITMFEVTLEAEAAAAMLGQYDQLRSEMDQMSNGRRLDRSPESMKRSQ